MSKLNFISDDHNSTTQALQGRFNSLFSKINVTPSKNSVLESTAAKQAVTDIFKNSLVKKDAIFSEFQNILKCIALQISPKDMLSASTCIILSKVLIFQFSHLIKNALTGKSMLPETTTLQDIYLCKWCLEILYHPITLTCGHTFCNKCVLHPDKSMEVCFTCKKEITGDSSDFRANITISSFLQKHFPDETKSRDLTIQGQSLLTKKNYQESIEKFCEALKLAPYSHLAIFHRAKANYFLQNYDKAIQDSLRSTFLIQKWPEAHFLKSQVLFKLHFYEESLLSLLLCYNYDPTNELTLQRIVKVVEILLHPMFNKKHEKMLNNKMKLPPSLSSMPSKKRKSVKMDSGKDVLPSSSQNYSERQNQTDQEDSDFDLLNNFSKIICVHESGATIDIDLESRQLLSEHGDAAFAVISLEPTLEIDLRSLCFSAMEKEFLTGEYKSLTTLKEIEPKNIDPSDFECILCMRLLFDPVCTPCGHVFCQLCIQRCLDHNTLCPLCKSSMETFLQASLKSLNHATDVTSKMIMETYMVDECEERKEQHKEEFDNLMELQPIFVCTIAFPSIPCPLHVFEPRYRLMLRRCLRFNGSEFGICMPVPDKPHHEIGTMLKVRDVTFFPDGRSVVESIGLNRFRTSNCEKRDGYNVAKFEIIQDTIITDEKLLTNLVKTTTMVHEKANAWVNNLAEPMKEKIFKHFGCLPPLDDKVNTPNGPDWLWWVLTVLPIENTMKATILGNNILKERLVIIYKVFNCLMKRNR